MKLTTEPFLMMESGQKTIELRLYDERRRQISVGDVIRFSDVDNPLKTILAKVRDLFVFESFDELYKTLPLTECGYTEENEGNASPRDMEKFYTPEKEKEYGVLGIKIEVISAT